MLSKKYRFIGRREPRIVMKYGKSVRASGLQLKYLKNNDNKLRVSVVVSKKVSKSAPKRNRIRRRIYETLRKSIDEIPTGYNMIFSVFDVDVAELEQSELETRLMQLLTKLDKS